MQYSTEITLTCSRNLRDGGASTRHMAIQRRWTALDPKTSFGRQLLMRDGQEAMRERVLQ
jgi:hypothetical protein